MCKLGDNCVSGLAHPADRPKNLIAVGHGPSLEYIRSVCSSIADSRSNGVVPALSYSQLRAGQARPVNLFSLPSRRLLDLFQLKVPIEEAAGGLFMLATIMLCFGPRALAAKSY